MRFYALWPGEPLSIGRDDACRIALEDTEVSWHHVRLEPREGRWTLVDEGSTNGVFVGGQRRSSARLEGGEVIRIGHTFFRFLARGTAPTDCVHGVSTEGLVGGPSLAGVRQQLLDAADSDLTVLLTGPTGAGKEVAARLLHQHSRRRGPFLPVNCPAIPEELFASELFGHLKGAFSGATEDAGGLFRAAEGGTLFLDEISELSRECQAKLLRVLQDSEVRPVGGTRSTRVDVRIVCAVNGDLPARVASGRFRKDLYARIAELEVALPPLAERIEDIPLLVQHFVNKHGDRELPLEVAALELLCGVPWELNVRQLENAVRRALLAAKQASTLGPQHLADLHVDGEKNAPALAAPLPVEALLRRFEGDVARVAEHLGISRSQVYRRAQQAGVRPADFCKR